MKRLKKIAGILACTFLILDFNPAPVNAEESEITYRVVYSEGQATITLYISSIDAFDIALIYDPGKVQVTSAAFTKEFKMLQANGENTTISIYNDDAVDKAGNTYAVFTGAGVSNTGGGAIDFTGKPLATITFEGDLSGEELRLITNSAKEENVMNAEVKETISLGESAGTVITPEPVSSNGQNPDNTSEVVDAGQNTVSPETDALNTEPEESNIPSESSIPEEEAAAKAESDSEDEVSGEETPEAEEDAADDEVKKKGKAGTVLLWIGAGFAAAMAAASAVILFIRKRSEK